MKSRFRSLEGKPLLYESYDHLLNLWDVDLGEQDIDTRFGKTHE
ncbi:hypothetical protein V1503_20115 [Bacillus sp. SCS-151]